MQRLSLKKKSFDYHLRQRFPSLSRLTFNPVFKLVVDAVDFPWRWLWPELRRIPSNHMRIRVGVGNRLLNNQVAYVKSGGPRWLFAFSRGYANAASTILDIGAGNGRESHILRDLDFHGFRFTGTFIGVDIDPEMVAYCRSVFDGERFRFHVATDASVSYNRAGQSGQPYRIPEPDGSVDYVTSGSLLTHLLERELENYLRESFRLLRPDGYAVHSFFSTDHLPASYGDRYTFAHEVGHARVESLAQPEAAVAYSEAFMREVAERAGFAHVEFLIGSSDQKLLICRKGAADREPRCG